MEVHADCDNGPTKRLIVKHAGQDSHEVYHSLCFAKRPALELYDCHADPDQVRNVAALDANAAVIAARLRVTDPRNATTRLPIPAAVNIVPTLGR